MPSGFCGSVNWHLYCLLRLLESLVPVQEMVNPGACRNDFIYTALHHFGVFMIAVFLVLDPLIDMGTAVLHLHGMPTFNLDSVV